MLFESAFAEMPLLVFSLLMPMSVTAIGLMGLAFGFAPAKEERVGRKATLAMGAAIVLVVVALVAAMTHVGSLSHVFGMANGLGTSPLSNEIVVAGISAVLALVYWIVALTGKIGTGIHRVFGIVLTVCGIVTGIFTGLAYMMPTIPTWNTPCTWLGQMFSALLGGSTLAAALLGLADYKAKKGFGVFLAVLAVIGGIGAIAVVFVQAGVASSAITSAGATLASVMGDYYTFAAVGSVLAVIAVALVAYSSVKPSGMLATIGCLAAIVGLFLIRVDFYGIFLTAGII